MNWLRNQYVKNPDATALCAEGERLSYRSLYERAVGTARKLEKLHGIRSGDRVATLLGNTLAHAVLLHALLQLRATLVPLNVRLRSGEIRRQIDHVGVKLLVTDQKHGAPLRTDREGALVSAAEGSGSGEGFRWSEADRFDVLDCADEFIADISEFAPDDSFSDGEEDDLLSIIFTSGTSLHPKAVPHIRRNHEAAARASAANLGVMANDNWLCLLPLHHIGGLAIIVRSVISGTAVTILDGFDEQKTARIIREQNISVVSFVPTMLHRVLQYDSDFTASSLPDLRVILLGGGPAGTELQKEILHRGLPTLGTYGMTETCSQVTTMQPGHGSRLSAGKPLGDAEIQIRDREGASCPQGESGEIHIKGSMLTSGYLADKKLNDRMFAKGWFRSGDIGSIDDSGNLHVLSRREDLIISGGENVLPSEIEERIQAHPGVREAAVVGVEDEEWGQVAAAVIIPETVMAKTEGLKVEIEQWCRISLAGYKIPRRWLFLDELPRTSTGKVRRERLRGMFGA